MNHLLKRIVPTPIKKTIVTVALKILKSYWSKVSDSIPNYELDHIHIQNAKILLNRSELLKKLPKNAVIAEIGVNKGDFSAEILSATSPEKFHLIDAWGSSRYNENIMQNVKNRFKNDARVVINRGLSLDVADEFEDEYFDWIYIDSDHGYKVTSSELNKYATKMKPGGIISGHDFIVGNWNGMVRYGVIEAVYEFCVKQHWEILYITSENKENPSFAIRKII